MSSSPPTSLLSVSVLQYFRKETYSATSQVHNHWHREPGQHGSAPNTMGVTSYYMITVHLATANPLNSGYILATQMSSVLMDVQASSVEDAIQTSV